MQQRASSVAFLYLIVSRETLTVGCGLFVSRETMVVGCDLFVSRETLVSTTIF
jgi:hypothetical protein